MHHLFEGNDGAFICDECIERGHQMVQEIYAKEAKENAEWHEKRSNDCIARGDLAGAKDHAARAASYRKAQQDAIAASKKCTK